MNESLYMLQLESEATHAGFVILDEFLAAFVGVGTVFQEAIISDRFGLWACAAATFRNG